MERFTYVNNTTGKEYNPHSQDELDFLLDQKCRWWSIYCGAGAGKTVVGLVKMFECLRAGRSGAMVAPTFPNLRKGLWPEFRRWCEPEWLIPKQRHRLSPDWTPGGAMELHFVFGEHQPTLYLGGGEDPLLWSGPRLSFAFVDDASRFSAVLIKTLDSKLRDAGPNGESPQGWVTKLTDHRHMFFIRHKTSIPGQFS